MNNAKSVRDQVLDALQKLLEGISATLPLNDPYGVEFSRVFRDEPANWGGAKAFAYIASGQEQKTELNYPVVDCRLTTSIEVNVLKVPNQTMAQTIGDHLTAVERALRENRNLSGLCVDITPTGTDSTEQGLYKTYGAGVVHVTLWYRHSTNDPRQTAGGEQWLAN